MLKILLLSSFVLTLLALPYADQMCLANSLIVGRDDKEDLVYWDCKVCDQTNQPLRSHLIEEKAKDVKCILSVYTNFVVLAFRYTNTALNVWQDILYPIQIKDQHTCSNCKVQKAYHNMWEIIKQDVIKDLIEIRKQTNLTTLYITGISMGGGLTVISFIDLNHAEIFPRTHCITFGAPRVGNKHWAAYFDLITTQQTKRYIIKGDPIVVLPRCLTLLCTYRQTGIQIVCQPTNGDYKQCIQEQYIPDQDDEVEIKRERPMQLITAKVKRAFHLDENDVEGIDSHLNDYPKLYNSTLILK